MKRKKHPTVGADAVPDVPVVFLDEPDFVVDAPGRRGRSRAFVVSAGLVAAVAAAVVLVAAIAPHTTTPTRTRGVAAALSATTESDSFDVRYTIAMTPGTPPPPTPPTPCNIAVVPEGRGVPALGMPMCAVPLPACDAMDCVHSDPPLTVAPGGTCVIGNGGTPATRILAAPCPTSCVCAVPAAHRGVAIACPIDRGPRPPAPATVEPDVVAQSCGGVADPGYGGVAIACPIDGGPRPAARATVEPDVVAQSCGGVAYPGYGEGPIVGPAIEGSGTIKLYPLSIDTVIARSGEQIVVHADDTSVSEGIAGSDPTRYSLSDFVRLAVQSLGVREGSVAMISLASPTGYLDLTEQQAAGATPVGTHTVDGVKVSLYEVTLAPDHMANPAGASPEELRTIQDALKRLAGEGYTGTTVRIGIGDDGLIHSVTSIANFKDGGKVTLTATFSNFGKAAPDSTTTTEPTSDTTTPTTSAVIIPLPAPLPTKTVTTGDGVTTTT
jgi:hypothetical protein